MRIAFIVTEFPSLSQTFVLNQITGLIDLKQDVDIFAFRAGDEGKMHEDVVNYQLLRRTAYLKQMPSNILVRFAKAIFLILTHIFKGPRIILRSCNFLKYGKLALSFRLLFYVIPFLDKRPYDIIHCHFGPSGLVGDILKSVGAIKGKLITSFHAYDLTSYLDQQTKNIYQNLFETGDMFQPVSDYWKRELIKLGCKEDKIKVHRMGIDLAAFSFSTSRYQHLKKIRILSVNRLVEKKGVEYSVRAFAKISSQYPDVEYVIVGDGPLKKKLLRLIETLSVKDKIRILGWMKHNDIQDLMEQCTILCAPSITDQNGEKEGIPVVLMEAMAKGLAVISTLHSGIPELVINNKTGLLVAEKDVDGLAHKMAYLISNPDQTKKMAVEARKVVEKNYNIQTLNQNLLKTYQKMVQC